MYILRTGHAIHEKNRKNLFTMTAINKLVIALNVRGRRFQLICIQVRE